MSSSVGQAPFFGQPKDLKHGETPFQVSQGELFTSRKPSAPLIDVAHIRVMPTFRRVMRYQWGIAGLEPKDVYEALGHDKATWSKIDGGSMSFQADRIEAFCEVTRNDAVIHWLAHRRGYDLRPQRTELEEQLEHERAQRLEAERENALLRQLITGKSEGRR